VSAQVKFSSNSLCVLYYSIALAALIICWSQNLHYFSDDPLSGLKLFWTDTMANPAARSITFDLFLLFMSTSAWMIIEGRRLRIRHTWAYPVFGFIIAISFTFPLFLVAREKALARNQGTLR